MNLLGSPLLILTKNMQATSTAYVKHALQTAVAGKTTQQLAAAAGGAAKSMGLIPLAYARMGGSLALQGAGKLAAAPFSMIGSMVGMGAGAGAAIAGIGGAAYLAKLRNDSLQSTLDGSRNIQSINAKLGIATEPLNDFVSALKSGALGIKTVAEAMHLTAGQARSAYGTEYADPRIKGLPDDKTATAYLRALGPMNPQQAGAAMGDIANNFGFTTASTIGDQYMRQTANGVRPYGSQVGIDLMQGVIPTIDKNRGWFQGMQGALPTEAQDLISTAFTAIRQEASPFFDVKMPNGADLGQAISGTRINAMTGEAFNAKGTASFKGQMGGSLLSNPE